MPVLQPGRRRWLGHACAWCAGGLLPAARAADDWVMPARHERPALTTDEGGLWALMDREEARLRRSGFLLRDAGLRDYLRDIACRLGGEHCPDIRVYPVRTPFFNASMAPNGMMEVWSGLLLRVDNEAQLAAVIGHEIGHYLQRHSLALLRDAKSRSAFMSLMIPFGAVGLVGQLAALGGHAAYSRDNEREADRIGIQLMRQAGYQPGEAARVWSHLRSELSAGAGGDPEKRSVMFASHPGIAERQGVLQEMAAGAAGELGIQAYETRIEPLLWQLCEDELGRAQFDESVAMLSRHCERRADHGALRYFLGEARRLRAGPGDLAAAVADFQQCLALRAPPPQAQRSLGYIYRQQGQRDAAAGAFEQYLQSQPDAPDAALIKAYLSELKP